MLIFLHGPKIGNYVIGFYTNGCFQNSKRDSSWNMLIMLFSPIENKWPKNY